MEEILIRMLEDMQQRYFRTLDNLTSLQGMHRDTIAEVANLRQENKSFRNQIDQLSSQMDEVIGK